MEFEWDSGNTNKNLKHGVSNEEAEEVFFDSDSITYFDKTHSANEHRFFVVGKTNLGRKLYIAYTVRNKKIRIISARNLNKKEYQLYEKTA